MYMVGYGTQVTLFAGEKRVVLKLTIGRLKREGFDGSHFRLPTLTLTVLKVFNI